MHRYFIGFYIALAVSFLATPIIREIVVKLRLFDVPDARKIHSHNMPKMGGIAFYLAFYPTVFALWKVNYADADLHAYYTQFLGLFICGIILFLLGIYDDIVGANAHYKFFVHSLVGIILMNSGIRVEKIAIPFSRNLIELPYMVSALLTVLWICAVINIMNLIDGMDGLASGVTTVSAFVFLLVAIIQGNVFVILVTTALLGSIIGFVRYNFPPAQIFMGDVGSMFIGFVLASSAIMVSIKELNWVNISICFLALGVPITDTSWAILRRIKEKRPVFAPDRGHVHHMLLDRGYSQKKAVVLIYEISCILGIIAVFLASIYYI